MKCIKAFGIIGIMFLSSSAFAEDGETVFLNPFGSNPKVSFDFANRGLSLQDGPVRPMSLRAKTDIMLHDWGLNPRIQAKQKSFRGMNLTTGSTISSLEYAFTVDGFPLCQYQIKSHETPDGKLAVFGKMPKFAVESEFSSSDWPAQDIVRNTVVDTLVENGVSNQFTTIKTEACLWLYADQLNPVWVWELEADGLNYMVVADNQRSYKFQAKHFHATGKANIYPHNILDDATQEFTLRDMTTTGYLENKYFITVVESPFDYAIKASLDFTFDPLTQSSQFEEVSLFTNANRALEWLETMGYTNFGNVPIRIAVHAEFQGDVNNALYQPGSSYDVIYVGDGDGTVLQNLATDADVVGHELGHHVVYHSVTEISGESLVLHEALADYFNFARTGNACLGESICPDTSFGNRICYVPKKCLRTADNALTLTSADLPREPHQRSQFISGMLWDLYVKDGMILEDITHLVLKSIDLLVANSGYKHFVVGMMMADYSIFEGKNCSTIFNRATQRGLGSLLTDISCSSVALKEGSGLGKSVEVYGPSKPSTSSSPVTSSKSSKKSNCGVLGGASSANGQALSFLILFILPLIPAVVRRTTRK